MSAATGSKNGTVCLWNLGAGKCELKLSPAHSYSNGSDQKENAILKIELAEAFIISLNEQHQMFIWDRARGHLIKEFTFLSASKNRLENSIDSGELTNDHSANNYTFMKSLFRTMSLKFLSNSSTLSSVYDPNREMFSFKTVPTMCLYSKRILITGGCSCIFLWNISKGELVKKITIRKPFSSVLGNRSRNKSFNSQNDYVKEIRIIERNSFKNNKNSFNNNNTTTNNNTNTNTNNSMKSLKTVKKLILITDYTDTFYLLKIPSNLSLDD